MTVISANTFTVAGKISNMTLYANTMGANGYSNITFDDSVHVNGDVFTNGRMDVGSTIYAKFRLQSNVPFNNNHEVKATSNTFVMDFTSTDMTDMSRVPLIVPPFKIYNASLGNITVPVNGLYLLEMQGVFANDPNANNAINGVFYRFLNHPYPQSRVATNTTSGDIVSTSHAAFLLAGDVFEPIFYSSDSNATLIPSNGETYISFSVAATVTPTHSNYVRIPMV